MSYADIDAVLALLRDADITVCVVGELALNYYNVPRVIHVHQIDMIMQITKADDM